MTLMNRLAKRQRAGHSIGVAVAGAGLIGRGIVRQVDLTPGMHTALIVNRSVDHAIEAFVLAGRARSEIVVSENLAELQRAIDHDLPAVSTSLEAIRDLEGIDVAVEVTGAVEYGAKMAICAIEGGKHVVMMNAETDATVGCALKQLADEAGVVYTNSDGDQPGVLMRLIEYVQGIGFEIVAAVNCKGFMDVHATPDTIRPWATKQNTSLSMTTAFTDGTKMNIENAVLCNATGLAPAKRGMIGVKTDMASALQDCMTAFAPYMNRRGPFMLDSQKVAQHPMVNRQSSIENRHGGFVDYTLGGNFGGGVFVIGYGEDPVMIQPLMKYLKMGDGPYYMFYRPYHLCHMETPFTIAEAALDHEPTIAPLGRAITEVVAIAKRDLQPGELLDGIGGFTSYGEIELSEKARGFLPIGLTERALVTRAVAMGDPIPLNAVQLRDDSVLLALRSQQEKIVRMQVA